MYNSHSIKKDGGIFYGWWLVALSLLTFTLVYGARFSFSIFYIPIIEEFGWSRASTASIYSLNLLLYGFTQPVAGYLVDKLGPRKLIPLGTTILVVVTILSSTINEIWQFYLLFGIAALGMSCAGYVPNATTLSHWFIRRRGLAIAIASAGFGTCMLMGPLMSVFITRIGWRSTYLVEAGIISLVIPLALIFQRKTPQDKGLLPDGIPIIESAQTEKPKEDVLVVNKEWANTSWTLPLAMRTYRFWVVFLLILFQGIAYNMIIMHQVAFSIDIGYSPFIAASAFGLIGITSAVGHALAFISDYLGREVTYTIGIVGVIIATIILLTLRDASTPGLLYASAIIFGLFLGLVGPTYTATVADIFQGPGFGSILGGTSLGFGIGGAIGPWIGGYIYDVTNSYSMAFSLALIIWVLILISIWLASPQKVRRVAHHAPKRL